MTTSAEAAPRWFKSGHSGAEGGDCLEVATRPGVVLVRDSKHVTGPVLTLTPGGWSAFVAYAAGR
ncbi:MULTISPECIES: DUF397 domain-containing protein [unclassified Streptomyces]|uniref:DUF397 domain-containing protein n=1 Tax=unclassified Streptomyces TaxID=2593676 RepID=UPI000CD5A527|nr:MULTISPECIES: DUF397 domain-containing protein [unclassified Streptomyces]AWL41503.1 DUF397 domain-containing protein [Streptomyces sp. SM18]